MAGGAGRPGGGVTGMLEEAGVVGEPGGVDGLVEGDVIWNPAPLFHVSAYVSLVGSLVAGCTYMTAAYFETR